MKIPGVPERLADAKSSTDFEDRCQSLQAGKLASIKEVPGAASRLQMERQRGHPRSTLAEEHLTSSGCIPPPPDKLSDRRLSWEDRCNSLREWISAHNGALPSVGKTVGSQERSLGFWFSKTRRSYRQNKLTNERVAQLMTIPGVRERLLAKAKAPRWEARCNALREWIISHDGALPRTAKPADSEEIALGVWLSHAKTAYDKHELIDDRLEQLMKIPGVPERLADAKSSTDFEDRCQSLQAGKLASIKEVPGAASRLQMERQRGHPRSTLAEEHLTSSGCIPPPPDKLSDRRLSWEDRCNSLREWISAHNGALPSVGKTVGSQERSLGFWFSKTRRSYRQNKLTNERVAQLMTIPGVRERLLAKAKAPRWEARCNALREWIISHDGALPRTAKPADSEEIALGVWLCDVKKAYNKKQLMDEQLEQLMKIPGVSERLAPARTSTDFEDRCQSLRAEELASIPEVPGAISRLQTERQRRRPSSTLAEEQLASLGTASGKVKIKSLLWKREA